jgi:hypothetical protein
MDQVQLCAQALCLEEMLGVSILEGSLFLWGADRGQLKFPYGIAELSRLARGAWIETSYGINKSKGRSGRASREARGLKQLRRFQSGVVSPNPPEHRNITAV